MTVEDALRECEAYLLATQLHSCHLRSHQVAAAAVDLPPDSEVTRMTEMMKTRLVVLTQSTTASMLPSLCHPSTVLEGGKSQSLMTRKTKPNIWWNVLLTRRLVRNRRAQAQSKLKARKMSPAKT